MGKLSKNYIYNICYQLLVFVSPLITMPYLSRILGASYLGVSNYVLTVGNIFATIGLLGMQNYSIREIAYNKNNNKKLEDKFYELYFTRFFLGIITIAIYIIYIYFSKYPDLMWIQLIYVIAFFIDPCWFYIGIEDMGKAVLRNFIAKIASIIGVFLIVKTSEDYKYYVFLLSFMTFFSSFMVIPYLWNYFNIKIKVINIKVVLSHIKESLKLFLPQIAIMIYMSVDKILLEHFISSSSVAYYDQADKIVRIPLAFITVLSTVMMPRLSSYFIEGEQKQLKIYLSKTIIFSMFIAFPMFFGIIGTASNFIPWYLGKDFIDVINIIWFISPIVILVSLIGISGEQYFIATKNTRILTISYSIAACSNVFLDLILIPKFSGVGAAIATVVSYLICLLIQYINLIKAVNLTSDIIYSLMYFFKSIPMFISVVFLSKILLPSWYSTIFQIFIGIIVYLITLILFGDKILKILLVKLLKINKNK